jgi:glycosyltransferase involved in cell wall biosynthesis
VSGPGQQARPLRVGLNLVFLGERAGGAGRYASELPAALLAAEPDTQVHVFVSRDVPSAVREAPWAQRVEWVTLPVRLGGPPVHVPAQFAALPVLARARELQVLHSPANTGPAITPGVASVVSLLDLIWLHRAQEWEPSARVQRRMGMLVRHCLRHVDRVFAISHAAAEDFVSTLGVARERIDVTPLGVSPPVTAPSDERELRDRLDLGDARILLCVAQKRPYKNLHTLVHALPGLPEDVVLLLPGSPTEYERELRELAVRLGVAERVRLPGWLSDGDLEGLYALSNAFVLPSLIEGFGIPVLEAMMRGVPVACASVSALPEVVGDAALLFDPLSQEEITHAARRLFEDRDLARLLIARGHERAREFTWERTGVASLAGYRRAIARRSHAGWTLRR